MFYSNKCDEKHNQKVTNCYFSLLEYFNSESDQNNAYFEHQNHSFDSSAQSKNYTFVTLVLNSTNDTIVESVLRYLCDVFKF